MPLSNMNNLLKARFTNNEVIPFKLIYRKVQKYVIHVIKYTELNKGIDEELI